MRLFVSYSWASRDDLGSQGVGNLVLYGAPAIRGNDDVRVVEQFIREDADVIEKVGRNASICLLNFKEL